MRAFIFSLDAFVAFTLALMAIYSLIFFSSVPESYYFILTQAHYLASDTLLSLSTTQCTSSYCMPGANTMLQSLAFGSAISQTELISNNLEQTIPQQYGFTVEVGTVNSDGTVNWGSPIYDRATEPYDNASFIGRTKKVSVASEVLAFGYNQPLNGGTSSPYNYLTCGSDSEGSSGSSSGGSEGTSGSTAGTGTIGGSGGIITCGDSLNSPAPQAGSGGFGGSGISGESGSYGGAGTVISQPLGTSSSPTEARLVRLTIYI